MPGTAWSQATFKRRMRALRGACNAIFSMARTRSDMPLGARSEALPENRTPTQARICCLLIFTTKEIPWEGRGHCAIPLATYPAQLKVARQRPAYRVRRKASPLLAELHHQTLSAGETQ